ncbi:threonine--tRNA ligase [Catenibacterium sp. AM22-15]|jgi:threonyl-tRNA synthetase|uniref:threonine--tRNA ligase n=1 Tax=Catenibacterium TaxID=135858 RepID=UPI000E3EF644|nr:MULTISPECIES: threonine--tRNA ligase [Catenibacterium]MBD9190113.1 threonine--tRNA ligase [Catenibacterium mitsuokai]MBU9056775.1 threonine--tRNA ligase [Catenibacterium mitsuokai]MCB5427229.1 threonine--tRNA ligase [Catenibacterium mitsuokai]RGF00296.1 threonine--tRNA ligase [Catenibacterium sp. AM22-6LB]RGF09353.1 threonine--tRNA ligase [Catenibacterium sp. AM22-15]
MSDFLNDKDLNTLNHSCAHVLAQAVKHLYPQAKFWVGPVVEEGFYYDIDLGDQTISDDDLPKIEKEMKKICKDGKRIVRHEVSKEEALEEFKDDEYKLDLINGLEDGTITTYSQGDFTDLCRGPHVETVKLCKNFKLIKHSGAYWKGDKNNKVLQRIYGVCFPTKEELEAHLQLLEEAKERDHRRLGKELGIFMFADIVGKGLPMWLPNGFTVRRLLSDYIMNKELELGYEHVMTPSLGNVKLYKKSGHWAHYKDDMFPAMELDDEAYVLRPMNCPHHMVMYKSTLHSYRDLPVRIAEIANDFRFEASGALTGIERARAFTQNDSHIFCRPDQIAQEFKNVAHLILDVYKDFGFKDYSFRLSLRDKNNKEKYFGNDELWEKSENELREVLKEMNVEFYEAEGEAAFYGPKLDVQVKSALGHDVTLSTIQLDYQLPERFELTYVDENGDKVRPVVIHRAILGSLDRFVAFLLEETKGNLPLWLAPTQVQVIPVKLEYHDEYAKEVVAKLRKAHFRVNNDNRDEKLGYRIREAQLKKIPYQLVLGDNERDNGTVTYRKHGEKKQTTVTFEEFVELLNTEVENKTLSH